MNDSLPTHAGPYGTATQLPVNPDLPGAATTVCWWLITAPAYHPAWTQYALCVVNLADHQCAPPARRHFPGATHELLVMALDPTRGPRDPVEMGAAGLGSNAYLTPLNIAHQFTATDAEMTDLAGMAAHGVVDGLLNPETADAPDLVREHWLGVLVKTLAHGRGEEHAP